MAACLALPVLLIRLCYGLAFLQLKIHHPSSKFLTSRAVEIGLNVVPEMLCVVTLLLAGVASRSVKMHIQQRDLNLAMQQDLPHK